MLVGTRAGDRRCWFRSPFGLVGGGLSSVVILASIVSVAPWVIPLTCHPARSPETASSVGS